MKTPNKLSVRSKFIASLLLILTVFLAAVPDAKEHLFSVFEFDVAKKDKEIVKKIHEGNYIFGDATYPDEKNLEALKEALAYLHTKLTGLGVDEKTLTPTTFNVVDAIVLGVGAEAFPGSQEVNLYGNIDYTSKEEGWGIVFHEYGHILESTVFTPSQMEEYRGLRSIDPSWNNTATSDWTERPQEIFAEDFAQCFLEEASTSRGKTKKGHLVGTEKQKVCNFLLKTLREHRVLADMTSTHWVYPAVAYFEGRTIVPELETLDETVPIRPRDLISKKGFIAWFANATSVKYNLSREDVLARIQKLPLDNSNENLTKNDVYLLLNEFISGRTKDWMFGLRTDKVIQEAYTTAVRSGDAYPIYQDTLKLTRAEALLILYTYLKY